MHALHVRAAALATALCLTSAAPAAGADEPLRSPLSLGELLAAVRRRNPTLIARRHAARAAAIRPRAEGLPDDPMVSFEWWQQPVDFSTVPLMLTVKQAVPWPGTLRLRREVAERESRPALDEADEAARRIETDATRLYFDLVLAERSLAVNERVRAIDAHLVEVTDALYRVGRSAQADVFKAQSELLLVDSQRLDLDRARGEALARLNALLDRPPGSPLGPTATPARLVALPPEPDLVARALAGRPELRRARDQLAAAEARASLEGRGRLPELAVWASYMVNIRGVDTFTAGVSSTLPIFASRREGARVEAAGADVSAARSALDAARRDAELAVHSALLELDAAARHVHLHAEKLIPLAELTLASAEASYRSGRADFPSLLEAARTVRDHHLDHLRFLVGYRRRLAELEEVVGPLGGDAVSP